MSADEVFLSGTAAEITPIIKIERKKIGSGKLGTTTKMIMETYTDIVMNKNKKFTKWLKIMLLDQKPVSFIIFNGKNILLNSFL